ncbi:trypsin [Dictyocaulus viviparus]|uniref:Trypsin n=1 Tax=Dictyocaulus viviparus TaxID=29172 RepID=A0A0D8XNE2_DICVI|nr:trypsin [Dictyocaulus viviparus]
MPLDVDLDKGPHRRVRSIGGTKAKQNEFPWVAAYYVHQIRPGFFSRKVSSRACSAVQISKRHVLTAAHCVVKLIRSCKEKGKKYSVLNPDPHVNFYEIFIGSGCTNPERCKHNRTDYSVTEVKVFEEYDPCEKKNDVALLDIVPDISPKHGSPICMTESDGILQKHLTAIGFGYDPIADYWMHGILSDLRSVNLTRVPARKPKRIAMFGHRKGVCKGDSGGPLTQLNSGNYTLQGITIEERAFLPTYVTIQIGFVRTQQHLKCKCPSNIVKAR